MSEPTSDLAEFAAALHHLEAELLRSVAPVYRRLRFKKTAAGMLEWADRLDGKAVSDP